MLTPRMKEPFVTAAPIATTETAPSETSFEIHTDGTAGINKVQPPSSPSPPPMTTVTLYTGSRNYQNYFNNTAAYYPPKSSSTVDMFSFENSYMPAFPQPPAPFPPPFGGPATVPPFFPPPPPIVDTEFSVLTFNPTPPPPFTPSALFRLPCFSPSVVVGRRISKPQRKTPPSVPPSVSNCRSNTSTGSSRSSSSPSAWGSQDSGRATGGLASSLSPAEEVPVQECPEVRPIYEFEIPNSLVGLIIGIRGKTIKELSTRAEVRMVIRPHHTPGKLETHQICTVEGPRENINKCLRMMRRRFPAIRFPELNLRPVLPPPFPDPPPALYDVRPMQLSLPEGERFPVICSAVVDVGDFFLQQPQHPSFSALHRLDYYMLGVYMQSTGVPDIPKPVQADKLCVAPALDGWYRAVTVMYYPQEDEVLVKYVDYGGYSRLPRSDLRQIRTDFMTLPFQAVECYLAHVEPVDGTTKWSEEAAELFQSILQSHSLECYVVGYDVGDLKPVVELFAIDDAANVVERVDNVLRDAGVAKISDPSKIRPVLPKPVSSILTSLSTVSSTAVSASSPPELPFNQPQQNHIENGICMEQETEIKTNGIDGE